MFIFHYISTSITIYDIRVGILKCEIILQDLIKRHDDDLNLKTPSGPQPHPSWVYRHNYAPFHSVARTATSTSTGGTGAAINVKRSLSFLKSSSGSTLLKSQESSTGKLPSIIELTWKWLPPAAAMESHT